MLKVAKNEAVAMAVDFGSIIAKELLRFFVFNFLKMFDYRV